MENQKINPLNTNAANGRQAQGSTQKRQAQARGSGTASVQVSSSGTIRPKDYGVVQSPGRLYEGDIIRGEVSDLSNNDITITLEDNTILKAKLDGSPMLSIGQTAAFRLSSISSGNILLEAIKNSYTQTELTLINKALDEAGLPETRHNQQAVKALMDNMLPINKESIQNLMQQSYDYKTDDMGTLAIMNRLMMDINSDTVRQFSNYMNGTHQLSGQIHEFAQAVPALLNTLAENGPSENLSMFGENLLSIALYDNMDSQAVTGNATQISQLSQSQMQELMELLSDTPLTEDVMAQLEDGTLSLHDALTIIRDAIMQGTIKLPLGLTQEGMADKLSLINTTLGQDADGQGTTIQAGNGQAVPDQTVNGVKNIPVTNAETPETTTATNTGKESLAGEELLAQDGEKNVQKETGNPAHQASSTPFQTGRFAFAGRLFQTITETARNSINNTLNLLQQGTQDTAQAAKQAVPETHTIIDTLTDLYSKAGHENDYLDTFLTNSERNNFASKLSQLPVSRSFINRIVSGEATAREVITVVKNIIPLASSSTVQELFQSGIFGNILGRFLQSSWSITPEKLKRDGETSTFYDKMRTQLKQFEGLIQTALSGEDSENLGRSAHDMESNIEFMKTLSETFSYMQMPLRLQNQDAHADLYVYTQKEKLKRNPDNVHVLLHLTLEHLGDIDIYLDKNKNDVNAKFMLTDLPSIDLIKTNSDMLKNALNGQGYSCQINVAQAETATSTVNEFIDTKINTSATADMKRFSFDIRA